MHLYPLSLLLKVTGLSRSCYYYIKSKLSKPDKDQELMDKIRQIFNENKQCYGYRRITMVLHRQGIIVNHKKVLRLMRKMNLRVVQVKRRKYNSYKGEVGKIAPNLIQRQFSSKQPNQKWYTDITEFHLNGEKLYLSPIIDGFNQEVISYNISTSPNLDQIMNMLNKAFKNNKELNGLIMHSDQGWQYQHKLYQQTLSNHGIKQSMSRKGNSLDNGLMENFFSLLKNEIFYGQEKNYSSINELKNAIVEYIDFYNNKRIKLKLKGLSPVQFRKQSLKSM